MGMGPKVEVEAADQHRRENGHRPVEAGARIAFGRTGFGDVPCGRRIGGRAAILKCGTEWYWISSAPLATQATEGWTVAPTQRHVATRLERITPAGAAAAS